MVPPVEEPVDPADELMFLCLGGGNEVGRSCHILQYKGKTVMVSFGFCFFEKSLLMGFYSSLMQDSIQDMMVLPLSRSTTISI
jgi:cleavage and polyadenylation specificity factor subunit 3